MTILNFKKTFSNAQHMNPIRANGYGDADFTVAKAQVKYETKAGTQEFPTKDVYYRTDNGEPIAIHGKRYKAVQYPDMIDKTRDMLERSDLNCADIKESIQVSPNGGMCAVKYTLPATSFKTPDGDTISATVLIINSFTGVWSFDMSIGGEQSACLNGQVFVSNLANKYKSRHTNQLNIDAGIRMLAKTADILENEIELWHSMYSKEVGRIDTARAFTLAANYTGDINELLQDIVEYGKPVNVKNKALSHLYDVYNNRYRPNFGANQWAVYNAITDWSTHAPSKSKNLITLEKRRTEQATTAIREWLKVA
tara:strand:- start:974 stop:1903 length:930 start_codon:yes stop_codon:yes gene_type:complete